MNDKIIIDALRKARIYINSAESWNKEHLPVHLSFKEMLDAWTEGGEIEAIDRALQELGIII